MAFNFLLIGLNHKTSPLKIREKLAFNSSQLLDIVLDLKNTLQINGIVILSTCNRTEIYCSDNDISSLQMRLKKDLTERFKLTKSDFSKYFYSCKGLEAIEHLFRVAAGLDSMVVGEGQILHQVKSAYHLSLSNRCCNFLLNCAFNKALSVGKRVRTETKISKNPVSISHVAIELAKRTLNNLNDKSVLIIGSGKIGNLTVKYLKKSGVKKIFITNRTYDKAKQEAEKYGAEPVPFVHLKNALSRIDIIISSTSAPHFIIDFDIINEAMKKRNKKILFIIDLAIPRDVAPEVAKIKNVILYNIDDLKCIAEENIKDRLQEVQRAEEIIRDEISNFKKWIKTTKSLPIIISLRKKMEKIKENELKKTFSRLKNLQEEEKNAIKVLADSIVNKIMHYPTINLKEISNSPNAEIYLESLKYLFSIDN